VRKRFIERFDKVAQVGSVRLVNEADDGNFRFARETDEFDERFRVVLGEHHDGIFTSRREEERAVEEGDGHPLAARAPSPLPFEKAANDSGLKLEALVTDDLLGTLVCAVAFEQFAGSDDTDFDILPIFAVERVRVLEGCDLHGGDGHRDFAARKNLAAVGGEGRAPFEHAERPAASLLVRAPLQAEGERDAPRRVEFVRRIGHARGGSARRLFHLSRPPAAERAQTQSRIAHLVAQRALEVNEILAPLFERVDEMMPEKHGSEMMSDECGTMN
jgi:hypothetical protein